MKTFNQSREEYFQAKDKVFSLIKSQKKSMSSREIVETIHFFNSHLSSTVILYCIWDLVAEKKIYFDKNRKLKIWQ